MIRIANTDQEIIDWTAYCLRRLGFRLRRRGLRIGQRADATSAFSGGLASAFASSTRSIRRSRASARSREWRSRATRRLASSSIEPLGIELPLFDITTGTGDFIANGVVSHNCFARPTHTYLDLDAGRDFEREIVVKVNVPERCCEPSSRRRRGSTSTSRSAPTPTPTSGSRGATG